MEKVLISVVVPVYNVEQYLNQCLDSIINQTYTNLQIILVDDGSTDNSGKICDNYKERDTRITVYHKKNGGVSSARNKGIDLAKGIYIAFIDADDLVRKNYLEKLYVYTNRENIDIAFCGYEQRSSCNNVEMVQKHLCPIQTGNILKDFTNLYLSDIKMMVTGPSGKLFDLNLIKEANIRFDCDYNWGEDVLFCLEYFSLIDNYITVPEDIYIYINHGRGSAVETYSDKRVQTEIKFLKRFDGWLRAENIQKKEEIIALIVTSICNSYMRYCICYKKNSLISQYEFYKDIICNLKHYLEICKNIKSFKRWFILFTIRKGYLLPSFIYYVIKFKFRKKVDG